MEGSGERKESKAAAKEEVVETVQVALRIRPLVDSEAARGCEECIEVVSGEPQVCIKDLSFTFNHVFPPHIGQQEFYDTAVKTLINKLFQGYNVTILAYGQTGSGKTYSMGTNYTGCEGDSVNLGVIPQAVGDIFDYVESHESEYIFKVSVSFMELYQEQCYDLLSIKPRNHSVVEIREDHRGVILPGLTEMEVTCSSETMLCLMRGSEGRAVGATAMNSMSSRSHAVFTIYIYKESRTDKNQATTSKFHLVDLAGSERTKKTKATGDRLKEGIKINQGLLALGNVISALGDGTNRGYICYRESKLTRLLQDSLGGNSLTLMVACVSPADYNLEETVSTLRYADRARRIRNKPVVNQDAKAAEIVRLNNLVNELRLQLIGKAPIKSDGETENAHYEELIEKERTKYNELLQKHKQVTESLSAMLIENRILIEKVLLADAAKEKMELKLTQLMEKCNQTLNMTYDKIPEENEDEKHETTAHKSLMECLKSVRFELEDMQSESVKYNEQMMEHDMRCSQNGLNAEDNDSLEGMQETDEDQALFQQEAHAMDQVALNKELNELNQAMAIKASVVKRMMANSMGLVTYHENLRENEAKVTALEKEKNELMQQLKNAQTKMKDPLTEERRSKVQALEKEISALRKQCQKHASVIQALKRDEAKINALNGEIRDMKVAKVNLIKRMRSESEKFRRWRAESERDVCRLKAAERKRANAMAKMESMHAKQQSVLKRKMEETVAVNRRLKEALDRQKSCQLKRSKSNNKTEALQQFLEQELEIQLSTFDAEKTLEELMEDRCLIVAELERLKTDADEYESNKPKIAELENDLALRKAQISDLQQRILTADQENKGRTRWDNVQSMMEAKWAMKYLFESLVETKRELQGYGNKYGNHEVKYQQMKEAHNNLMSEYEQMKREFEKKMSVLEMQHEEKVSALMSLGPARVAGDAGDACLQLQAHIDYQQERLEKLEAENERLQGELEELRAMSTTVRNKKQSGNKSQRDDISKKYVEPSDEEVEEDDDEEKDPEWRATPMYKRLQAQRSRLTMNFTAADTTARLDTTSTLKGAGVKRGSDGTPHCACRGSCSTKLCGCRKADVGCGMLCKCPHVLCKNRRVSDASDDKENTPVHDDNKNPDSTPSYFESKGQHDGTFIKRKKPYFFYPPTGENENIYAKD